MFSFLIVVMGWFSSIWYVFPLGCIEFGPTTCFPYPCMSPRLVWLWSCSLMGLFRSGMW